MKKLLRLAMNLFISGFVFLLLAIAFLEIGSRTYECPVQMRDVRKILACDPGYYPLNPKKVSAVQKLVSARKQGSEPTKKALDQAVNWVKDEKIPGANGVACGSDMIFVRDSLGREAKYFVARHEMEHIFLHNGLTQDCPDLQKEEYCATITAAKIYPAGFIETIFSSLYVAYSKSPNIWCFLFGSWRIFRMYILPF